MREKLNIPRGERYELCRSGHAAAIAIIAAPRDQMLGATLYMTCIMPNDGSLVPGTNSGMMCKKQIINAGIEKVVIRNTETEFTVVDVADWVNLEDDVPALQ